MATKETKINRNCESNKEKYNYGVYWLPLQIDIHTNVPSFPILMMKDSSFSGKNFTGKDQALCAKLMHFQPSYYRCHHSFIIPLRSTFIITITSKL